ncbi:MAG: response regulator transcription factor [Chloroflexi bacterium]|nr:response regulator transcription factor [Chloroflexota bacterium]
MLKILLVDDQLVVREGLRAMLQAEPDFTIIGEASSGTQALAYAIRYAPDVILLDIRMPGMDGLSTLAQLKQKIPTASIIMVTLYDNPDYLLQAVASGASGYILKDSSREELVRAIRVTREGGAIISPTLLPELLRYVQQHPDHASLNVEAIRGLTPREMEILKLIAEGNTNQQIAAKYYLSPTTVKTHVQNIFHKLGVSDRTQAAVLAVRCGLI